MIDDGETCEILLRGGRCLSGVLQRDQAGWFGLRLEGGGAILFNPGQVQAIASPGVLAAHGLDASSDEERGRTTRKGGRKPRGGGSPGRPWSDDELRLLADAFLDGAVDRDLAKEFGRTPGIVKQLREGFEVARGNLVDDQVSELAASWVHRWRRVLHPG